MNPFFLPEIKLEVYKLEPATLFTIFKESPA